MLQKLHASVLQPGAMLESEGHVAAGNMPTSVICTVTHDKGDFQAQTATQGLVWFQCSQGLLRCPRLSLPPKAMQMPGSLLTTEAILGPEGHAAIGTIQMG